jgi:O-antigen ligase
VNVATQPDRLAALEGWRAILRRAGWAAVCLCAGVILQSLFHQPVGTLLKAGILAFVVIAGARPHHGLLLLAAFGPLSGILFHLGTSATIGVQFSEAVALAFITGWAAGRVVAPAPLAVSTGTRWAAVLLLAAAVASGVTGWVTIRMEALGEPLADLVEAFLTRDYLLHLHGSVRITAATLLCEGAILLLIAADICARSQAKRDSVLGAMVMGAAAAGLLNLLRIVTAAMAQEDGWAAFVHYVRLVRVNVQYADLNAAGSYFALMLPIGLGLLAGRRTFAAVCNPPIAAALWISGSRSALGGAFLGVAISAFLALPGRSRRAAPALALAGLILIGVLAGALWRIYPAGRNPGASASLSMRVELAKIGLDMAARHPVFGVGLGSYYVKSEPYLRSRHIAYERENAHNYFIQILAELGLSGLLIFLAVLAAPMGALWRSAKPLPTASVGLFAGLTAFLLSCVGGHPLIVPEASYPFWIALGLAAAPLGGAVAAGPQVSRRALRAVAAAVLLMFVVTLPYRIAESVRTADMSNASLGMSPHWQHDPDGTRFRWASGRSAFYVSSQARAARIPLRNTDGAGRPLEVRIFLDGREADGLLLPADGQWRVLRLILRHESEFSRIDLVAGVAGADRPLDIPATDQSGVMQVGQPTIEN